LRRISQRTFPSTVSGDLNILCFFMPATPLFAFFFFPYNSFQKML
jgi:hypothetical protein